MILEASQMEWARASDYQLAGWSMVPITEQRTTGENRKGLAWNDRKKNRKAGWLK